MSIKVNENIEIGNTGVSMKDLVPNIIPNGDPVKVGYKFNGKDVYAKCISFKLSNASYSYKAHGLNLANVIVVDSSGTATNGSNEQVSGSGFNDEYYFNTSKLDRRSFTCYIVLYYINKN